MKMKEFDCLKLSNQLCFPLYVCSKEINKKYVPYLTALDLTYTQYITMLVMWENETIDMRELEKILFLDSGTLTPVLKKLENKNYITKKRSSLDNRNINVELTDEGRKLKDKAINIPGLVSNCICLNEDEAIQLYTLCKKIISNINNERK